MKIRLPLLFILFYLPAISQAEKDTLSNIFIFRAGIYSTFNELLHNQPKYPGCKMNTNGAKILANLSYADAIGGSHHYKDSLFALVQNNKLYIFYKSQFYSSLVKGTLTVLSLDEHSTVAWGWNDEADYFSGVSQFCLDFQTGETKIMTWKNFDIVLRSDKELYAEFSSLSKSKKKEMINYFLFRFNKRNPTLIGPDRE
jgi:hypothetical protein